MASLTASSRRAGRALPLSLLLLAVAVTVSPWLFVTPPATEGRDAAVQSRRSLLLPVVTLGAAAVSGERSASAASFPGLGTQKGPFELDPKEAVIVGDAKADASVTAKQTVQRLLDEAEKAMAALEKDPQADLVPMIKPLGISELRRATNTINNLMDDSSAAGTQRLQRLMIQAKYQVEDDIPMPISKKGVVQPRGEKRLERIREGLTEFIRYSKDLLQFL